MTKRRREELMWELARKWQEGTISEEEKQQFNKWYHSFDDTYFEETSSESPEELGERLYRSVIEREKIGDSQKGLSLLVRYWAVAASVLFFIAAGLYFYSGDKQLSQQGLNVKSKLHDISPGGNRAILTLADGSTIILDSAKNGLLANQGNISIRKDKDGRIVCGMKEPDGISGPAKVVYNSISTPRGGQYRVDLPDGTKVWLNAASTLKFPSVFNSKERRVELDGEAYFEVNPSQAAGRSAKAPFIVASRGQEVKVLGTHFNVNAYSDEGSVKTTLLEGAVRVVSTGTSESKLLYPGQQAKLGGSIQILDVDTEQEIAWKNGYFVFDNENVQSIMRKISRWYDVEVEYKGNIQYRKFGGTISKFENVSEVLRIMELTASIHFQVEERRIIVMP